MKNAPEPKVTDFKQHLKNDTKCLCWREQESLPFYPPHTPCSASFRQKQKGKKELFIVSRVSLLSTRNCLGLSRRVRGQAVTQTVALCASNTVSVPPTVNFQPADPHLVPDKMSTALSGSEGTVISAGQHPATEVRPENTEAQPTPSSRFPGDSRARLVPGREGLFH